MLICTDVAARGLHLPSVDWVVQYSSPTLFTDYVHRVGRTARVGSNGRSVLFLLPTEADYIKCLNEKNIRYVLKQFVSNVTGLDKQKISV